MESHDQTVDLRQQGKAFRRMGYDGHRRRPIQVSRKRQKRRYNRREAQRRVRWMACSLRSMQLEWGVVSEGR